MNKKKNEITRSTRNPLRAFKKEQKTVLKQQFSKTPGDDL